MAGVLLAVLVCAQGCERSDGGAAPEADKPREAPSATRARPETVHEPVQVYVQPDDDGRQLARFTLGASPAPTYRTAEPVAQENRALAKRVRELAPQTHFSQCLARAARAYASHHPWQPSVVPPRAFVEFALHWAGCPDSTAAVRLYYTTEDGTAGLDAYLAQVLEDSGGSFTHIGVARAPGNGTPYRWTWALLLTRRSYELAPFPRAAQPGELLDLSFTLAPQLEAPEVLLMPPDGRILNADLSGEPDASGRMTTWRAQVPMSDAPGVQWLEILASGPLGPEVVALFPVYVGQVPPVAWHGHLPPDESWIRTPQDAEQLAFRLINRDRAEHGLPALVWDEDLARIARAHSEDMRDAGYFAHVSPQRGTLGDRFAHAGYEARFSAENIARNPLVYDAQVGLMESLGHRANILSLRPTRVGVGVAEGRAANDERTFFITQNFARPVLRPQPAQLRTHIRTELDVQREEAGLTLLEASGALDRIATEAAQLAARSGFDGDRINTRISEALASSGVVFRRFRVQYQQVLEFEDFEPPTAVQDAAVRQVGLGVAEVAPRDGAPAMLVTLVLLVEH